MDRIFVQIPSYRDAECQATVNDLFVKAAYPQRISIGICVEDDPTVATLAAPPGIDHDQLRIFRRHWDASQGICAARREAQLLWRGEEYVLSIESRMRFINGWDVALLAELAACRSQDAVLSYLPAFFSPPNVLDKNAMPTVVKALPNEGESEIRFAATVLDRLPKTPLLGAFVSSKFIFSTGKLIEQIPYDPYLDADQEEASLSARLYTHGFDVYSPSKVIAYHSCYEYLEPAKYPKRAAARFAFLRNAITSAPHDALLDLDMYDFGLVRSLDAYRTFSGLDMRANTTSLRATEAQFIELLSEFSAPTDVQDAAPARVRTNPQAVLNRSKATFNLSPMDFPHSAIDQHAPPGVLLMREYLDKSACREIVAYAAAQGLQRLGVRGLSADGGAERRSLLSTTRVTDHVAIDGIAFSAINLFNDIFCNRVAPFFETSIEYYERPQLLRYDVGGYYHRHADSECWDSDREMWRRTNARDFSVVLYLNDDYDGGEFYFVDQHYTIKPERGMLLAFPSDHRYVHAALPTTSGIRFAFVSWAKSMTSPSVASAPALARIDLFASFSGTR